MSSLGHKTGEKLECCQRMKEAKIPYFSEAKAAVVFVESSSLNFKPVSFKAILEHQVWSLRRKVIPVDLRYSRYQTPG